MEAKCILGKYQKVAGIKCKAVAAPFSRDSKGRKSRGNGSHG